MNKPDTVMFIDPIIGQAFNYATGLSCDNNPQYVIALHLDNDKHYELTLKPVLRANPTLCEPKPVQSAKSLNSYIAQQAGIFSNAEYTIFRNPVFLRNTLIQH